jgi:hypothetical protein
MKTLGRARDVLLGEQDIERDEQIEIEPSQDINHGNACNFRYSFPLYPCSL